MVDIRVLTVSTMALTELCFFITPPPCASGSESLLLTFFATTLDTARARPEDRFFQLFLESYVLVSMLISRPPLAS